MKNATKRYCILAVMLVSMSFTLDGYCADSYSVSDVTSTIMPASSTGVDAQEYISVQDAVTVPETADTATTESSYYWGQIDDTSVDTIEQSLDPKYYSSRRLMSTEIADGKLTLEIDYQSTKRTIGNDWEWGNNATEISSLDLTTGEVTKVDGTTVTPDQGVEYFNAVNELVSTVRIQTRYGADTAQAETLNTIKDYLGTIKEETGGSKYYYGSGLDDMTSIGDVYTNVQISDNTIRVSDVRAYSGYSLDMLTGDMISVELGPTRLSHAGSDYYKPLIQAMLGVVSKVSGQTADAGEKAKLQGVTDYLNNIITPSYYWGPISDMSMTGTENQLYYTDQRASNQRVRTLTVAGNTLTADVQYQNQVDSSNPHYENVYRETTALDLKTGAVTTTDGSTLTPADGDKYVAAVNDILSVERYQERSADAAQLATLTPVKDYLTNIKEQSGGSKYYFGAGMAQMSIGTGETGAKSVKVNVNNDVLFVSDIDKYTSYTMDLLTGDVIASFASSGINPSTPDEAAYKTYVQGMLGMVDDASMNTPDVAERAKLQGVTDFLNNIIAPAVSIPAIVSTAATDRRGNVTLDFTSGTLLPSQLTEFRAQVSYDGKTEDWDIGTGALNADGNSITLQFNRDFSGKTVQMQFYGIDINNKKTDLSNSVAITVREYWRRPHHRYNY